MTSTYTSNPPSNATAFRTWLERTAPGTGTWRNCRYLVWGLGNSQWNAFLAFPRYVQQKLADLGATPLADLGFGDVGSPVWERLHADWNSTVWPVLLELSGAKPTADAAVRVAAGNAATGALTGTDSTTAMHRSLYGDNDATKPMQDAILWSADCSPLKARRAAATAAPKPPQVAVLWKPRPKWLGWIESPMRIIAS